MPWEVAIVSGALAFAGWAYLRVSRRAFERKYGADPE